MIEYTRKDIIMDPNDPRLEGAIGKKVYSSSDINLLLNRANDNEYEMTLTQVEDVDSEPFTVMNTDGTEYDADFIIIKKEKPKPECVPFESMEEFVRRYREVMEGVEADSFEDNLFQCGMWLRDADVDTNKPDVNADTDKPTYRLVYEMRDKGVRIPDYGFLDWENLLYSTGLTFLDGSPCGKEVK